MCQIFTKTKTKPEVLAALRAPVFLCSIPRKTGRWGFYCSIVILWVSSHFRWIWCSEYIYHKKTFIRKFYFNFCDAVFQARSGAWDSSRKHFLNCHTSGQLIFWTVLVSILASFDSAKTQWNLRTEDEVGLNKKSKKFPFRTWRLSFNFFLQNLAHQTNYNIWNQTWNMFRYEIKLL